MGTVTSPNEPRVLVVDDNEPIADTYAAFLSERYAVETVYGGEDALEAVGPHVDVVLLDRRMPDLSGDEVLAEIHERALDCRVVVVTAVDPDFDVVDMPFDGYVVKPVGRAELLDVVDEMASRSAYDDEFRQFLALVSKKATLERRKDEVELSTSPAYDRVEHRVEKKRERLGVDTGDVEGIFAGTVPDIAPGDAAGRSVGE
ncbi:MAG: response regulator transcription factor [Haloarculaceae archaeon]